MATWRLVMLQTLQVANSLVLFSLCASFHIFLRSYVIDILVVFTDRESITASSEFLFVACSALE